MKTWILRSHLRSRSLPQLQKERRNYLCQGARKKLWRSKMLVARLCRNKKLMTKHVQAWPSPLWPLGYWISKILLLRRLMNRRHRPSKSKLISLSKIVTQRQTNFSRTLMKSSDNLKKKSRSVSSQKSFYSHNVKMLSLDSRIKLPKRPLMAGMKVMNAAECNSLSKTLLHRLMAKHQRWSRLRMTRSRYDSREVIVRGARVDLAQVPVRLQQIAIRTRQEPGRIKYQIFRSKTNRPRHVHVLSPGRSYTRGPNQWTWV